MTSLEPLEFNCYKIDPALDPVTITLCLKEFKAILGFCEFLNQVGGGCGPLCEGLLFSRHLHSLVVHNIP